MKKLVSLVLAVAMLLCMCASGVAESGVDLSVGKPFMKYDEPITVSVMASYGASDGNVDQVTSGYWTQAYAERFNINLDWKFVATAEEYNTRVNLMLATGELPDIMTVDLNQLKQMIAADLVQPLDELYDNGWFWDSFYEAMTQDGTFQLDISSSDGHRYAIPWVQPITESVHAMFINNDWLAKVGKSAPTTLDELEEVVYAFTKEDPDNNGKDDTYGFGLNKKLFDLGYEALSLANIMGAYPDYWIKDESGKVVYGSVQENMKPVLEKLRKWYADGCIDPEFTVKSYADVGDNMAANKIGLGFGVQWLWLMGGGLQSRYDNMTEEERDATLGWTAFALPSVDGTTVTKPAAKDRTDGFLVVTKNCKHPEAAAIIANYIHFCGIGPQGSDPTKDGSRPDLVLEYGDHATDPVPLTFSNLWSEWTLNVYHPETLHNNLGRWQHCNDALEQYRTTGKVEEETQKWIDDNYLCATMFQSLLDFEQYGQNMKGRTNAVGTAYTWDNVKFTFGYHTSGETFKYAVESRDAGNVMYDCLGANVTETMEEVWQSLQDKEMQVFTGIITGDLEMSAFDDFVNEWKSNGGDIITDEVNAWYSETFGN